MHTQLKEKLWAYIVQNNPDLMFRLQDEYGVVRYLEEKVSAVMPLALQLLEESKPGHVIHELCLEEMTKELKPSKYNYIKKILSEEFEEQYASLKEDGLLTYESVNLVEYCSECFEKLSFNVKNENDQKTSEIISGRIADYFFEKQQSNEIIK